MSHRKNSFSQRHSSPQEQLPSPPVPKHTPVTTERVCLSGERFSMSRCQKYAFQRCQAFFPSESKRYHLQGRRIHREIAKESHYKFWFVTGKHCLFRVTSTDIPSKVNRIHRDWTSNNIIPRRPGAFFCRPTLRVAAPKPPHPSRAGFDSSDLSLARTSHSESQLPILLQRRTAPIEIGQHWTSSLAGLGPRFVRQS
jgi:hypothetical protein